MRKFSSVVAESRGSSGSSSAMLQSEITKYISKVNRQLPYNIQKILYLTQKYDLGSSSALDEIRNAGKTVLKSLVDKYNIPLADLTSLWQMLKDAKKDVRMLPQYMSAVEREAIEAGKLAVDDLTMDLKTEAGRRAVSKMYVPVVLKIVSQYLGKSNLGKPELISAGMMGLANAINDWKPVPDEEDGKVVPFRTYASYRIKQQILNDMNQLGHSLSGTSSYAFKTAGAIALDAISIDGFLKDDGSDKAMDRIAALGVEADIKPDELKTWDLLYKAIDREFSQRDADIFYRYFGLNGRVREKSKDIAKSYNMSPGNIQNSILKKILKWIQENPKTKYILADLQDIYSESLVKGFVGFTRDQIIETLVQDDVYLFLEEANIWRVKDVFMNTLNTSISKIGPTGANIIESILESDQDMYKSLNDHRDSIILFLECMYMQKTFISDSNIIEHMQEIQKYYKKYVQ